ncbi:FlgO family outer membrane protein [Halomonas koreensis]|uniref:FlgO family outer membrane protein n=1 Tax=Halomonas koreensis TaxID=245385 RepID=A0ABU1G6A7_9GAMM|nr:FlgO family outer membrane protein [Halomonas koreensis]MDR5868477.1 FlgO family outer membrane protein [Halomonas koreensis]
MTPLLRSLFRPALPLAAALSLTLGGCAGLPGMAADDPADRDRARLDEAIEAAAAEMVEARPALAEAGPLIAASFADIDALGRSSTLGRMATEIAAAALTRAGLEVREVRMRGSLFIEEGTGELMLSRQVQRLSADQGADAILVGTYARGQDSLYLTMRVIRARDAMVLGASSLRLPLDNDLRAMLGGW